MGLTMGQRRGVTKQLAARYRGAEKQEKGRILDTLVELAGYNRCYAGWVLRHFGREYLVKVEGQMVRMVVGAGRKRQPQRPRYYNESVKRVLEVIWKEFDYMCGSRLAVMLKEILPVIVGAGELRCSLQSQQKLMQISGATIDRLLREEKQKRRIRPQSSTKPTSLLKAQIPVLSWSELQVDEPGHLQADLVGHDGGNARGEYAYSLDSVDLFSGWVEPRVQRNRAHKWTAEALDDVKKLLPVPLKSLHTDNGGEFINTLLAGWCIRQKIDFFRARPHRRNDTCHVEQKNYNIIRQAVGYARFDTDEELQVIREIYEKLRLLVNHFYPSVKLIEKRREGSRVYKRYDKPQSPYQRLMRWPGLPEETRQKLQEEHRRIRPMQLKAQIDQLQEKLYRMARNRRVWGSENLPQPTSADLEGEGDAHEHV
jgi:hypothetical protein